MRRIYPPPFVVFIFYGLLSLAVITSAQEVCEGKVSLNPGKRTVVGYVRGGKSPSDVQVNWDSYDYINIVVNNLVPTNFAPITVFNDWISARNDANKHTKILLSIRDYDVTKWGADSGFFGDDSGFLFDAIGIINNNNLDGLDIEYPGARGRICDKAAPWDEDKVGKFTDFFKNIKGKPKGKEKRLGDNKVLMLTVSKYDFELLPGLDGNFNILNVETYHDVLYNEANYNIFPKKRFPNAPFDAFLSAYNAYTFKDYKLDKTKLVMGVDFRNTIQVVTTEGIETLGSESTASYELDKTKFPDTYQDQIDKIEDLCANGPSSQLYTFPWSVLLTNTLSQPSYCVTKDDWSRRFDQKSYTPWLFKAYDNGIPNTYYFVSYEDIISLSKKLSVIGTVGISISDIRYDDDDSTLLNLVRYSKFPDGANPAAPSPGNNGKTQGTPNNKTEVSPSGLPDPGKPNISSIVGGVLGGLMGSVLLVTAGFLWYRRKNPKTKEIPRGSFASHTALKNEGEQNQIVQNTVIPVAPGYVTAMFDFTGKEENDLSFRKGDKIEVLEKGDGPNDWWVGRVNGVVGEFPGNYVKET